MHRFCGWLLRTKYYIKKGYDSIAEAIMGTDTF